MLGLILILIPISIHAPREGRDYHGYFPQSKDHKFQSTRPARGATFFSHLNGLFPVISIHAPREGRDSNMGIGYDLEPISIHAPREGRDALSELV